MKHTIPKSRQQEYQQYVKDMKMIEETIAFAKKFKRFKDEKSSSRNVKSSGKKT